MNLGFKKKRSLNYYAEWLLVKIHCFGHLVDSYSIINDVDKPIVRYTFNDGIAELKVNKSVIKKLKFLT